MIETSETIGALCKALVAAQSEMDAVSKDAKNPHFKSKYASLENVISTARPVLTRHGLGWTQAPNQVGRMTDSNFATVDITTRIYHESGEWMQSTLEVPLVKVDPQGLGSAITYGCRYALMAILGLPPTDDDAESAMQRKPEKFQTPSQFETQVKASLAVEPVPAKQSAYAARKDGAWTELIQDLHALNTREDVLVFASSPAVRTVVVTWPDKWREEWRSAIAQHIEDLMRLTADDLSGLEGAMP